MQSKMKRRKIKGNKSEDEGFESPTPISPTSNGPTLNFDAALAAPLANPEDLEEEEKHETEITKEATAQEHPISVIMLFKISLETSRKPVGHARAGLWSPLELSLSCLTGTTFQIFNAS